MASWADEATAEEVAELITEELLDRLDGLDDDDTEAATELLTTFFGEWASGYQTKRRLTVADLRRELGQVRARLARGERV